MQMGDYMEISTILEKIINTEAGKIYLQIKGDRVYSESDLLCTIKGIAEVTPQEHIREYINKQKKRGAANVSTFEVEYYKRIASAFAAFILTFIGVSLSCEKKKGGMGLSLGIGLGLSFSYILFSTISATFAINANWPPLLAVWIPNFIFFGISLYLYRRTPK